ncbi:MAG: hypothetical protein AAFU73_00430 [Planctomycetota bacterium]
MPRRSRLLLILLAALALAQVVRLASAESRRDSDRVGFTTRARRSLAYFAADAFGLYGWIRPADARFLRGEIRIEGDVPRGEELELVVCASSPATKDELVEVHRERWDGQPRFALPRPESAGRVRISLEGRFVRGHSHRLIGGERYDRGERLEPLHAEVGGHVVLRPRFVEPPTERALTALPHMELELLSGGDPSTSVSCFTPPNPPELERVRGDGSLQFGGVTPPLAAPFRFHWADDAERWVVPLDFQVTPVLGETVEVDLPLERARPIRVCVRNERGTPVAGLFVDVELVVGGPFPALEQRSGAVASTADDGCAVLWVHPGRLTHVRAYEAGDPHREALAELDGAQAEGWLTLRGEITLVLRDNRAPRAR